MSSTSDSDSAGIPTNGHSASRPQVGEACEAGEQYDRSRRGQVADLRPSTADSTPSLPSVRPSSARHATSLPANRRARAHVPTLQVPEEELARLGIELHDLDHMRHQEALRRRRLLGPLVDLVTACIATLPARLTRNEAIGHAFQFLDDAIRSRAHAVGVPARLLRLWLTAYMNGGQDGLVPIGWTEVAPPLRARIAERYVCLGPLADAEFVTHEQLRVQADTSIWSVPTFRYWWRTYRAGGLWALTSRSTGREQAQPPGSLLADLRAPEAARSDRASRLAPDPSAATAATAVEPALVPAQRASLGVPPGAGHRSVPRGQRPPPALGTRTNAELEWVMLERAKLDALLQRATEGPISNSDLALEALALGISLRTLRYRLERLRRFGVAGLLPQPRSDAHRRHGISPRMVELVEGIRLSHPDWASRAVYDRATQIARALGEIEPSPGQVRAICAAIPEAARQLADGREDMFRNRSRLTHRMTHSPALLILQIDHKEPLDVLVRDLRAPARRSPTGEVRPYMTLAVLTAPRLIMSAQFSYDPPTRATVGAVIRDAVLVTDQKPYGGVFDEVWVDNGRTLIAQYVRQLVEGLGMMLYPGRPYEPQVRGIVERMHLLFDTRLWSTLDGYVGANTTVRNPNARATLTLAELEERFWKFVDVYHRERHSELGQTPLEYWTERCFAPPVDERELDVLLDEPTSLVVQKAGVHHRGRIYWHEDLGALVRQRVLVRGTPSTSRDGPPDTLEVYVDNQWWGTVVADDSPRGRNVTAGDVAQAQMRQRRQLNTFIAQRRHAVRDIDHTLSTQTRSDTDRLRESVVHGNGSPPAIPSPSASEPPAALPAAARQGQAKQQNRTTTTVHRRTSRAKGTTPSPGASATSTTGGREQQLTAQRGLPDVLDIVIARSQKRHQLATNRSRRSEENDTQ